MGHASTGSVPWRAGAKRSIFMLGDEAFEGGDPFESADIDEANTAIAVANGGDTKVHTYYAKGDAKFEAHNTAEFARVAGETGGQAFTYKDTLGGGFQAMLESVICASKAAAEPVEDCGCCAECVERRLATLTP